MKRRTLLLAGAAGTAGLAGCAAPDIASYAAEQPVLDLRRYFDGTVNAWGVFTDRSGKVVRRFTVVMLCSWRGQPGQEEGVLDEAFTYSDGSTQRRVWRLKQLPDGLYTGEAEDVVGLAQGQQRGNAFRWTYTLALPVDGRIWHVQMDDWMYLMNDRVLLNKATMRKFGLQLGEVMLSFTKA